MGFLRASFVFIPLFLYFAGTVLSQTETAYIQVVAEPGITVFLDGREQGKTTAALGGLIIEKVASGSHLLKVTRDGFKSQEERITVKAGEVFAYRVKPMIPGIQITQSGNTGENEIAQKVGGLKIQSIPVSITVSIPKLGINDFKTQDVWNLGNVPAGKYLAIFTWSNKTIRDTFEIKPEQTTHHFINMLRGVIEVRPPNSLTSREETAGADPDPGEETVQKPQIVSSQPQELHPGMSDGNPVKPSEITIREGQEIWNRHCKSCHGKNGAGDGPKSWALKKPPVNFSTSTVQDLTDLQLFHWINSGRDEMPAYSRKITDDGDRWKLVNYIRTLRK